MWRRRLLRKLPHYDKFGSPLCLNWIFILFLHCHLNTSKGSALTAKLTPRVCPMLTLNWTFELLSVIMFWLLLQFPKYLTSLLFYDVSLFHASTLFSTPGGNLFSVLQFSLPFGVFWYFIYSTHCHLLAEFFSLSFLCFWDISTCLWKVLQRTSREQYHVYQVNLLSSRQTSSYRFITSYYSV